MFSNKEQFIKIFTEKLELMNGISIKDATIHDYYYTLGNLVREYMSEKWISTNESYRTKGVKKVYYLSIEFLLGSLLGSNLINLGIREICKEGLADLNISLDELEKVESDPGLGNGGLGRLAACFLDSLAALELPGHGFGIRYKHGLFEQKIVDGYQVELPDRWLKNGNVWEVRRSDLSVDVKFFGEVESYYQKGRLEFRHIHEEKVLAVPYDMPIVGYHNDTVNTLRLWNAEPAAYNYSPNKDFMTYKNETEAISEFLYPDDSNDEGKILRLKQQYFLVSASIQSIIYSYRQKHSSLKNMHDFVAIQINDTHPVLAIPELMRILVDEEKMDWDEAWNITVNTFGYTNHTTLSEALEKWPVHLFKKLLPRIYMIVDEINERFCKELWNRYPGCWNKIENMAIIAHGQVKMAHLAIAGSHSVNGVAKIHTDILKEREMKNFYEIYPEKFNNKTNGITFRRWLIKANPELTSLITSTIGESWQKNSTHLKKLSPFAMDDSFKQELAKVKFRRKEILADYIAKSSNIIVDPSSIFDVQVKRMHAYKRQLLNIFHIMYLYNRLKEDNKFTIEPRTFIFAAKASPGYYYAKKIIKLITSVAEKVNNDSRTRDILKVVFLENYSVSLAELIMPAAEVSEQISTASKEASGTGNMKFMLNGAVTVGTLDGATIEIAQEAGRENCFLFGLEAHEVVNFHQNGGYHSFDYYHHDNRIKKVLDSLINGYFQNVRRDEFETIYDSLLYQNDEYFVLKDFASYCDIQEKVNQSYKNKSDWYKKVTMNIANAGQFSSDRTIMQYATDIWQINKV